MPRNAVGVISGGSGSSKFAAAFHFSNQAKKLGFVSNVGDNFWFHQLYVCPDIDILTYALSGKLDSASGWGIKGDSRNFLKGLEAINRKSWFKLGDQDLAVSVVRTELMRRGFTLSKVTNLIKTSLRIKEEIVPASDDDVPTNIYTNFGKIHLQEFWVKMGGKPRVYGVEYSGVKKASPSPGALKLLSRDVLILPANPITSILPTLSLRGVKKLLASANVIAISPFIGKKIFSGPAAKLMRAMKLEPSSFGVANLYHDFLKMFFVDNSEDESEIRRIRELGIECIKTNIRIDNPYDGRNLVKEIMTIL